MDSPISHPPPNVLPYGHAPSAPSAKLILARTFAVIVGLIFGGFSGNLCGAFAWRFITLYAQPRPSTIVCRIFGGCCLLGALVCGMISLDRRLGKTYLAQGFFVGMGMLLVLVGLMIYVLCRPW